MSRVERRAGSIPYPPPPPSKCAKVLYYTWRLCSVLFSHLVMISLVVAYCILGAVTFERLEAQHEKEVKQNISQIRSNTTQSIWRMSREVPLFNHSNWTTEVVDMLKDFENAILLEMKVRGWDGSESPDHIQWTFTGALFYSIIVITTIGYGHIAPKTQTGKVVTIFYAILGIPLMLLCLSNIGDVMASSFRFLYWRVCCYVCTRPPKRTHRHRSSFRRSGRAGSVRASTRRKRPPAPASLERAHSDTDCRYRDSGYSSARRSHPRPPQLRNLRPSGQREYKDYYGSRDRSPVPYDTHSRDAYDQNNAEVFPKISLPLQDLAAALKDLDDHNIMTTPSKPEPRSKSLPRPPKNRYDASWPRSYGRKQNEEEDGNNFEMHDLHDVDYENYKERKALEERERRRKEMSEDYGDYRDRGYDPEDDDDVPRERMWSNMRTDRGRSEYYERDLDDVVETRRGRGRRARSAMYECERPWHERRREYEREDRIEQDLESGRRRLRRLHTVEDTGRPPPRYYSPSPEQDEWSDEAPAPRRRRPPALWGSRQSDLDPQPADIPKEEIKPVPIWLCVFLVASYIVAGTFLFKRWEGWEYLDAAYFCFITLTTIGFGDFVPAQGQTGDAAAAVHSIALCSLYLLFGIALLAMSFNLVQEEVRANVASVATKLGIIKPKDKEQRDSDSDY